MNEFNHLCPCVSNLKMLEIKKQAGAELCRAHAQVCLPVEDDLIVV